MLQLTGTEAMLIRQEDGRQPPHISLLLSYDLSTVPLQQVLYREILAALRHCLPASSLFRRRLVTAPLNLHLPYWIEDDNFDLDYHVRHIALPRPGNRAQLGKLLARLHRVPLDLNRPLWEVYVIEGLTALEHHGAASFALLLKLHLAALQQLNIPALLEAMHTATPAPAPAAPRDDWRPEPTPPLWRMLSRSYAGGLLETAALLRTAGAAIGRRPRRGRGAAGSGALPDMTGPDAPLCGDRVIGGIDVDRAVLRTIARAVPGLSTDDVLAAIIGGALRRYLQHKGGLPAESLCAAVPVEVPRPEAASPPLGLLRLSLGTSIANPVERLSHIRCAARGARAELRARTSRGEMAANPFYYLHESALRDMLTRAAPPFAVFLSRLHSPHPPRYFSGAALQSVVTMGSVMDQTGLSHTATCGRRHTSITFVACRALLPDPEFYGACLSDSLHQLQRAVTRGHCA